MGLVDAVVQQSPEAPPRRTPAGVATNDLLLSARVGTNADLFPQVLDLYFQPGARIADVTYGKGVFWREVPPGRYRLIASDLSHGVDARDLPFRDGVLDGVVFDPPYMHAGGQTSHEGHQHFENYYANNQREVVAAAEAHDAVLRLYFGAAQEAWRVLKPTGLYLVKCQDEVCANRQRLTHVEILTHLASFGWLCEDLFVLVRTGRPGVSRMLRQLHGRKNHSYLLVMRKAPPVGPRAWTGP
jgi:hypothetical protein